MHNAFSLSRIIMALNVSVCKGLQHTPLFYLFVDSCRASHPHPLVIVYCLQTASLLSLGVGLGVLLYYSVVSGMVFVVAFGVQCCTNV